VDLETDPKTSFASSERNAVISVIQFRLALDWAAVTNSVISYRDEYCERVFLVS